MRHHICVHTCAYWWCSNTDGNEVSSVFSDGNSNSSIQMNAPAGFDVTIIGLTLQLQIFGNVTSTTAPAFADQ